MNLPQPDHSAGPPPHRRKLLYGAVAAAAAMAGGSFAWWKFQPKNVSADAVVGLWSLSFDTPDGGSLAMATFKGKPLLINFWATWCPPCVEELPLIDAFYKQHSVKNWQVLALAIDQPTAVRDFLVRMPLSFPIGLAGLGGTELGKALGNLSGGLPFSVVLGADGGVRHRKIGRLTAADLDQWSRLS